MIVKYESLIQSQHLCLVYMVVGGVLLLVSSSTCCIAASYCNSRL